MAVWSFMTRQHLCRSPLRPNTGLAVLLSTFSQIKQHPSSFPVPILSGTVPCCICHVQNVLKIGVWSCCFTLVTFPCEMRGLVLFYSLHPDCKTPNGHSLALLGPCIEQVPAKPSPGTPGMRGLQFRMFTHCGVAAGPGTCR